MKDQDVLNSNLSSLLIIDDNPQNLQVLGKMLQENNFEIEFATNGYAALEWLNTRLFDLILLDINMPEMNGFEVCSAIRENKRFDKVPIVFLSADTDRNSILKGFELGAQDYVTKPFDSRELLARVRTQLSLKKSLEKLEHMNITLEEKVEERTLQLQQANDELKLLNDKLLELDKAKAGFLNLISHEIRTPLNGIVGPLQLLKDSMYVDELALPIEMLDKSIRRLERFSIDALLITRLKTNLFQPVSNPVDIKSIFRVIKKQIIDTHPDSNFDLEVTGDEHYDISGDSELVMKALYNIIENSLLYSTQPAQIEVNFSRTEPYTIIEIRDRGKGFDRDILLSGYDLFKTGEVYMDSRLGIGLPMTNMIMEAQGGKMEIGNRQNDGAFVRLYFANRPAEDVRE